MTILFEVPATLTAEEFKERRLALGSQRQVARALGLTRYTLSRWENSRVPELPWHPQIVRLALEALEERVRTFTPVDVAGVEAILDRGHRLANAV